MAKQKASTVQADQQGLYYLVLVAQKIALLAAAAGTIILWATLIATAQSLMLLSAGRVAPEANIGEVNQNISLQLDRLTAFAAVLSLIAIVFSLGLLAFPRVKKYSKQLVLSGVIIGSFCFVLALYCQPIYRYIIAHVIL